jgi:2'-5' RNA ligase
VSEPIRAFIAAVLPADVRAAIGRLQQALTPQRLNLRWVKPANIHLTLKFLGDIGEGRVAAIKQVVGDLARQQPPLRLAATGLGVFPGPQRPRVMWVGLVGDTGPLAALAKDVEAALADVGFAPEQRPFKAHLTIGRFKKEGPCGDVAGALAAHRQFEGGAFTVTGLHLFRSQLRPEGPIYTDLAEFYLAGCAAE